MPRPREQIERALKKKGFELREGDHRYYRLVLGDRDTAVFTKVSTGSGYKDYGDRLLGAMARQLKLTKQELLDLIDCPMDRAAYLQRLVDQGVLGADELDGADE